MLPLSISAALLMYSAVASANADTVLMVGSADQYRTIADAVNAANLNQDITHHYVIVVAPGTYVNDFPHVKRPITIEADIKRVGEEVLLRATEDVPNGKGIILSEADLTVDGLSFEGAKTPNKLGGNAAGIRDQNSSNSARLIVKNSTFSKNQNGILTSPNSSKTITVLNSRFKNNGNESITGGPLCCQHALYVSQAARLTVENSLFCGQLVGHDVKSRALVNFIGQSALYIGAGNSAVGCEAGSGSFAIDIPNGGVANISDNELIQGRRAQNHNVIAYGEEGLPYAKNSAYVSRNTFRSSGVPNATAVYDPHCVPVELVSNSFSGVITIVNPAQCGAR